MRELETRFVGEEEKNAFDALHEHDFLNLFDELSFREKWVRVCKGLRQPIKSGAHKWARLQIIRLLAPVAAVLVPLLILLLLAFLAHIQPAPVQAHTTVKLLDHETPDEIVITQEQQIDEHTPPPEIVDFMADVVIHETPYIESLAPPPPNPSNLKLANFNSVSRVRDMVGLNNLTKSRTPGNQDAALKTYIGEHTTNSVLRALRWLAKNQHQDGSWGKDKPAMTSLALLAYLAHGDTPISLEFGNTVEKALRFLIKAQNDNGRFAGRDGHDYTQPIAAYALSEAYGMTQVPQLKQAAIKAIQVVVNGQNASGSFNYGLVQGGTDRDDLSYAGWCVQALKAASISGLESDVPEIRNAKMKAIEGTKAHFRSSPEKGYFGYGRGGAGSNGLTGVGVLSLQFLGDGDCREARMGMKGMQDWSFNWQNPPSGSPLYYWYYITQAYFQAGGPEWQKWNIAFSHGLVQEQRIQAKEQSGYLDHLGQSQETGYWISPSPNEHNASNDEIMDTILCTLMLEVYYRHLPTFRQLQETTIENELGDKDDIIVEIVAIQTDHDRINF